MALDKRVATPAAWLSDWEITNDTIANSNDVILQLYKKNVAAGELVTLGTNGQSSGCVNYTVFAVEAGKDITPAIAEDVNADGAFGVADVVMLQKWLLGNGTLTDWQAGDLCKDGKLDVFDLCMMKCELLSK